MATQEEVSKFLSKIKETKGIEYLEYMCNIMPHTDPLGKLISSKFNISMEEADKFVEGWLKDNADG